MRTTFWLGLAVSWMLVGSPARAAHLWEDPKAWLYEAVTYDRDSGPCFGPRELTLDLFGSYLAPEPGGFDELFNTDIRDTGLWGGGVGLTYYPITWLGFGADVNVSQGGGTFFDHALASLYVRIPWQRAFVAPYFYGGGGMGFGPDEALLHGGLGIEYRITPTLGAFFDTRYIWADETTDRLQFRAGLRLVL